MKRREFITLLGGAAAWPLGARAQQADRRRIIAILGDDASVWNPWTASLVGRLRELGWIEDRNVAFEYRWSGGQAEPVTEFAAEFVRQNVDAIVTYGGAVKALKQATASIPIVFANAGDPVGQGFVQSLPRPGGNLTGIAFDASPDITAKQAQLLLEVVPTASRLAVLWNPTSAFLHSYWSVLKAAAPKLRVSLQPLEVRDAGEFEAAFDSMTRAGADGLIVLSDTFATFHRARLADLAAKHRLPTVYGHGQYVEAGGLMSYGPSLTDTFRHAAGYVDKILKGAKPADLPVEQPTKFELIINLKTAKALGLEVPPTLLARADEVIE